jgi:hypothetical protein
MGTGGAVGTAIINIVSPRAGTHINKHFRSQGSFSAGTILEQ